MFIVGGGGEAHHDGTGVGPWLAALVAQVVDGASGFFLGFPLHGGVKGFAQVDVSGYEGIVRVVDIFPQEYSLRACQGDEPDDCGVDAWKYLDRSLVVFDGGRAVFVEKQWAASQRVEAGGFSLAQYR